MVTRLVAVCPLFGLRVGRLRLCRVRVAVSRGTFSSCGFDGELLGVDVLMGCVVLFLC